MEPSPRNNNGFRKGYSTKFCLLSMLVKWKSAVDKGKYFDVLLTDLSKAFGYLFDKYLLQNYVRMVLV